jgi:hypothetical protein
MKKRNLITTYKGEEVHKGGQCADRNTFSRARGRGRGRGGEIKCFVCGKIG